MGQSGLKQRIGPDAICVVWAKSRTRRRIVKVLRRSDSIHTGVYWWTEPYAADRSYPSKRIHEDELTLIDNEMELLAWMSATDC